MCFGPRFTPKKFFVPFAKGIQFVMIGRFRHGYALRKGHNYATSVLNAETGRILAIVPHKNQDAIEVVLKKVTGKICTVISDFAPAMAGAIQAVFPAEIHVLDRFHLVQFFTDVQQRRRCYLGEAKKRLKDWLKRYQFHPCSVVAKIAKTVIAREEAMINTIYSPFSNGVMEGTNNKIKLIKRRGFGYRNDAHLFLRL